MLVPREVDKMMIWTAAQIAEGRKKRGIKLNHPEAVAYIANYVVEGAREGQSVAEFDEIRKRSFNSCRCYGRGTRINSYCSGGSYFS